MKHLGVMVGIVIVAVMMLTIGYRVGLRIGAKEAELECSEKQALDEVEVAAAPCDTLNPVLVTWVIVGDSVRQAEVRAWEFEYVDVGWTKRWPTGIRNLNAKDMFADKDLAEAELCRRLAARRDAINKKLTEVCRD